MLREMDMTLESSLMALSRPMYENKVLTERFREVHFRCAARTERAVEEVG